jgi:hypothetical protein
MKFMALPCLVVLAAMLAGCGGGSKQSSPGRIDNNKAYNCDPAGNCTTVPTQAPAEQRCVKLWNQDAENASTVQSEAVSLASAGRVYVSVGFAADYPDLCLVTLVSPSVRTGMQFLESDTPGGSGEVYMPEGTVDPTNLDPSLKNWNAEADDSGYLRLTTYEPGDD